MDRYAIGRNLKAQMDKKQIGNYELAQAINVNVVTVARWIKGERQITVYALKRCAEYFGVSMDELAEGV